MKEERHTTIVVAHRLSTVRDADSIAVIYKGCVKEQGTHNELMNLPNGYYSTLVRLQNVNATSGDVNEDTHILPTSIPTSLVRSYSEGKNSQRVANSVKLSKQGSKRGSEPDEDQSDNVFVVNLRTVDKKN
eukprot:TRINITY_DN995_c0_g1_i1.p3 TRINITY_DN995_c0_g1~~TRINITY_DN995_c0_g1_i1.p3  ORF type:complete len:131 (-),score=3.12 TRINITY_DN995_c0_g1_i1:772-1164(-)